MKSTSQAKQDIWVYNTLGKNKTYIEIGAALPKIRNNTYNLEVLHRWKGYSIELDSSVKKFWRTERKNKCYYEDAKTFDHIQALKNNKMSKHVNYVSCDIEPAENTFIALKNLIDQGITFDLLTFEHDKFRGSDIDYDLLATEYLKTKGYNVAVSDVYFKDPSRVFETWYANQAMQIQPVQYLYWLQTI